MAVCTKQTTKSVHNKVLVFAYVRNTVHVHLYFRQSLQPHDEIIKPNSSICRLSQVIVSAF